MGRKRSAGCGEFASDVGSLTRSDDYEVPGWSRDRCKRNYWRCKHEDIYMRGGAGLSSSKRPCRTAILHHRNPSYIWRGYVSTDFPWDDFIKVKSIMKEKWTRKRSSAYVWNREEKLLRQHGMHVIGGERKKSISMQYVRLNKVSETIIKCFQLRKMSSRLGTDTASDNVKSG